jgi:hypothetical protein
MQHSDAAYVPFYGPDETFIGMWVREPDHPNLKAILEMFAVGEGLPVEVFAALSSRSYRRVNNDRTDIGNGVVFVGGAFLMLGGTKAPNERSQQAAPASSSTHKKWWQFWR